MAIAKDGRNYPAQGETWRHYLGKEFTIFGMDFMPLSVKKGHRIYFGEQEKAIAAHDIPDESSIVIYSRSGIYHARSRDNFMEILGNTRDKKGGTMFYRFERVRSPF